MTGITNGEITIIKSRRKTMSLKVGLDGEIIVKAPLRTPKYKINEFVENNRDWIRERISEIETRKSKVKELGAFTREDIEALADKALGIIPQKVEHFAGIIGVTYGKITIRNQKTRWGSCSAKGNLNFNCLLVLMPEEIIDYVVVHELCHRKELNHSVRFWKEVGAVLPDYEERKKWLNENGRVFIDRMIMTYTR
jgi:hypothetical protein